MEPREGLAPPTATGVPAAALKLAYLGESTGVTRRSPSCYVPAPGGQATDWSPLTRRNRGGTRAEPGNRTLPSSLQGRNCCRSPAWRGQTNRTSLGCDPIVHCPVEPRARFTRVPQRLSDRIRTCDFPLPKRARYQAALHSGKEGSAAFARHLQPTSGCSDSNRGLMLPGHAFCHFTTSRQGEYGQAYSCAASLLPEPCGGSPRYSSYSERDSNPCRPA